MNEERGIGTYMAGIRADIARRRLWEGVGGYLRYQVRHRNWRAVRQYLRNWWMAEWHYPPDIEHQRCGVGFTRRGALRSLGRHLVEANLSEEERRRASKGGE